MILNIDGPYLTDDATQMAESFLVKCLKASSYLETCDELRVAAFVNKALKIDLKKNGIHFNKYQETHPMRLLPSTVMDPINAKSYGYNRVDDLLVPEIVITMGSARRTSVRAD